LVALALPSCATDPEPAYFRMISEAHGYEESGNLAEAERLHRLALEEIRNNQTAPDRHLMSQMSNLGVLLTKNGQSEEGLTFLQSALEIVEGMPDGDRRENYLAFLSINFGRSFMEEHRLDESEAAYLRALDLANEYPDFAEKGMAAILAGLSLVALHKGEVVKADAYFEKTAAYAEELDPKDRTDWARFIHEYDELIASIVEDQR
jgi:tetratricopeptide (TPR) repeat protein